MSFNQLIYSFFLPHKIIYLNNHIEKCPFFKNRKKLNLNFSNRIKPNQSDSRRISNKNVYLSTIIIIIIIVKSVANNKNPNKKNSLNKITDSPTVLQLITAFFFHTKNLLLNFMKNCRKILWKMVTNIILFVRLYLFWRLMWVRLCLLSILLLTAHLMILCRFC